MYEIVTHDGKTYQLATEDKDNVSRLAKALELIPITLSNGNIEYFSKGTVARLQKSSQRRELPENQTLPDGMHNDRREPAGDGYARYQRMKADKLK